jgi:hypothetical protein
MRALRAAWLAIVVGSIGSVPIASGSEGPTGEEGARLFRETVEPVLAAQCYRCHSEKATKLRAGLRLDSRAGMLKGGDTGPAVVPGKIDESLIIQAIRHEDGLEMPPKKPKLDDNTIAAFERWIALGAPGSAADVTSTTSASPYPDEARRHWAFQPVKKPATPRVEGSAWVNNPIDAFVLAKLEERHWSPAPDTEKREWLRRVTFDLTGLPPTPGEIDAFLNDRSNLAYENVVDHLLASPRYGERWAQHWLDVVRFAESEGYEYDRHIPDAWRYRDYVIDAINRDTPFDRFLTEQIAGDEVAPEDPEARVATMFHRLGPVRRNAGNPDIALSRNEVLTERTDVLGSAILGLTVGCARCHNHKLEPIAQKDYYRLQAFLAASEEDNVILAGAEQRRHWEAKTKVAKAEMERLQKLVTEAKGPEKERLTAELEAAEDRLPPPLPTIPATRNDFGHRTPIHVLRRGVWENKGEAVGPRPPGVLVADDLPELPADVPDPRTRLARWLTSPENPLTARVFVNRLWQHHFGMGLVKTVNDFGTKGDRPSHPELLDWLAATFVEDGWRSKPIHRLIVLSHTYRQSCRSPIAAEAERSDPEDRLLWRFRRRRLEAEEVRDAMLAASGRLNLKAGGPSVMVPVDDQLVHLLYKPSQWQPAKDPEEHDRRSIYLIAKRNLRLPFFETFDAPALLSSCARRESSTHAPQALEMLNGPLANDLAASFARRLERESCGDRGRLVDRGYLLALGRPPSSAERAMSLAFLREQPVEEFALALFNLNGFLYVP